MSIATEQKVELLLERVQKLEDLVALWRPLFDNALIQSRPNFQVAKEAVKEANGARVVKR